MTIDEVGQESRTDANEAIYIMNKWLQLKCMLLRRFVSYCVTLIHCQLFSGVAYSIRMRPPSGVLSLQSVVTMTAGDCRSRDVAEMEGDRCRRVIETRRSRAQTMTFRGRLIADDR